MLQKIAAIVKYGIKLLLAGTTALLILSLFTYLYEYSGIHITDTSGATDYKWEPGQWKATMTEGFAWMKMDGNGYNNPSVPEAVDMLIMGSSHMEAVNIPQEANASALLNKLRPGMSTYNIGTSGHTIYHCVNNMEAALRTYKPSGYVILETDTIKLDTEKMDQVVKRDGFPHIPSYDSGMLYWLQKYVPAVKSLYKKFGEWMGADGAGEKEAGSDETGTGDGYQDALDTFLGYVGRTARQAGVKAVIFYHPSTRIDASGSIAAGQDAGYITEFGDACDKYGIRFVDMTEDFAELYEERHILAHGFNNTAVGEGHLNRWGHKIIAERLVEEIGFE